MRWETATEAAGAVGWLMVVLAVGSSEEMGASYANKHAATRPGGRRVVGRAVLRREGRAQHRGRIHAGVTGGGCADSAVTVYGPGPYRVMIADLRCATSTSIGDNRT
ncbi:hypothetical protein GCM10010498_60090 [Streptomyces cavourensis]|nr:hypothetical protein GCM10010498_60090 [Streptomyces cavourensis]